MKNSVFPTYVWQKIQYRNEISTYAKTLIVFLFTSRGSQLMDIMAIGVVEFSNGGYKIRKILSTNQHNIWVKGNFSFGLMASCQKVPKFDFQSQFSMSKKIIRIFLNFVFIEEYQFRSTFLLLTFLIKSSFKSLYY